MKARITALIEEFHTIRKTDFETDEAYDQGFDRREAIKVELAEILDALQPDDKNDELVEALNGLADDRYILVKRHVALALDRMDGKAPPAMKGGELRRIAKEGTAEDFETLTELVAKRKGETEFIERFCLHVADVRLNGAEPDSEMFLSARNDEWGSVGSVVEHCSHEFGWMGFERSYLDSFPRDLWSRYPEHRDRAYLFGDRLDGLTATDFNDLLGDPSTIGIDRVIEKARQLFPNQCAAAIAYAKERKKHLRTNWEILTAETMEEVEKFLAQYKKTFDPVPDPEAPDIVVKQAGPFQIEPDPKAIFFRDRYGKSHLRSDTEPKPTCLAWDGEGLEVIVGTGGGLYAFDRQGELTHAFKDVRGRPIHSVVVHAATRRLAVVRKQEIVIVDLESREVVKRWSTYELFNYKVAWNVSGSRLALFDTIIEVLDTTTWEAVHKQLRMEEEWKDTESFCWLSDGTFVATVAVYLPEQSRPDSVDTTFTDIDNEIRSGVCRQPTTHITLVNGELLACDRKKYTLRWYAAEELGSGGADGFLWSPLRTHKFTKIHRVAAWDGRAVVSTTKGLFIWGEGKPQKIAEPVNAFSPMEDAIVAIRDGEVGVIPVDV